MRPRCRIVLVAATAACTGMNPAVEVAGAGDGVEAYARDVHPILEARCATLDCHGDPGRPLRLYAETGLRARDELRGLPITQAELEDDVRALFAVDPGADPSESFVLRKPLTGTIDHVGGDVWPDAGDAQPTCVAGWLAGRSDMAIAAACAAALLEVALPP